MSERIRACVVSAASPLSEYVACLLSCFFLEVCMISNLPLFSICLYFLQADFFVLSYTALVMGAKESGQSQTEMYESLTKTWSEVVTTFPYFSQALEKDRTNHIILFPFDHGKWSESASAHQPVCAPTLARSM